MPSAELAERLRGLVLGTAIGDAYGLPYENLAPDRVDAWMGDESGPLRYRLLPGGGMLSDDTEHAAIVLQSLSRHPRDPEGFALDLGRSLRWWMASVPPGIGGATLRACCRLWLGYGPARSGVRSAGNGPCMRAPAIGVFHRADPVLRAAFVRASTRITHTDPRAEIAAQAVARLASLASLSSSSHRPSLGDLERTMLSAADDVPGADAASLSDWTTAVSAMRAAAGGGALPWGRRGPSGYAFHSAPAAAVAWRNSDGTVEDAVRAAVRMGGDTDSVAAITGALVGATGGTRSFSDASLAGIRDWPLSTATLGRIATRAATAADLGKPVEAVSYPFWPLPFRNAFLLAVVAGHVVARPFRRRAGRALPHA